MEEQEVLSGLAESPAITPFESKQDESQAEDSVSQKSNICNSQSLLVSESASVEQLDGGLDLKEVLSNS